MSAPSGGAEVDRLDPSFTSMVCLERVVPVRMNIFFRHVFPGYFFHVFFPLLFLLWSSRKGRGRSTKASVTVTKGGNGKGIPLTRGFFAVVFSFTGFGFLWARFLVFRRSSGKGILLNEGEVGGERNYNRDFSAVVFGFQWFRVSLG